MARREQDNTAPTIYPLGHHKNPHTMAANGGAPERKVPTPHPVKVKQAAEPAAPAAVENAPAAQPAASQAAPVPASTNGAGTAPEESGAGTGAIPDAELAELADSDDETKDQP